MSSATLTAASTAFSSTLAPFLDAASDTCHTSISAAANVLQLNNNNHHHFIHDDHNYLTINDQNCMQHQIVDSVFRLTDPDALTLDRLPTPTDYPLATLIETLRLFLFLFMFMITMTVSQMGLSAYELFMDIMNNFDEHFSMFLLVN